MHSPFSFWSNISAAFLWAFLGVRFTVRAIRSEGRMRRLNVRASVASMLACCAMIASGVWLA